jgi:hypothetical protein
MGLAHSTDIGRDSERRRWRSQASAALLNDNHPAGALCPACGAWAPIAPVTSDYVGKGRIHHHWQCEPCGHAWTTIVHLPS